MDSQRRLEELFSHFPGIGPRQARRFVYYLLSRSPTSIRELVSLIEEVKKSSHECDMCHRFFVNKNVSSSSHSLVSGKICSVCSDPNRDNSSLMIVARDSDFESVEKSGAYKGLYFILGGTVPIMDKEPEKRIRLKQLIGRITVSEESKGLSEVILSLNTTPDGENTEEIVKRAIESELDMKTGTAPIKVSVLGRGLSTGAELEYADQETIKNALKNRH
ncbi:MAG: toprim domain-containing protein [Candidatus Paceibacterota bacterium]